MCYFRMKSLPTLQQTRNQYFTNRSKIICAVFALFLQNLGIRNENGNQK